MKNNRISKKFNRKTKIIMLVSSLAIALLTVGYATFTTTLNIGNTTASIPAGTNNLSNEVVFGSSSITTSGAADAGSVVGTASGQTWNSSTAVFTSSIRSIVFTAPVYNNSAYDVYLTSMQSTSGAKLLCTNGTGDNAASSDIFNNFCNNTKATYSFGGTTVECDVNKCKTTLNSYELVSGGGTSNVTLTVSTLSTSTPLPDGQISISIPGITVGFSTTMDTNLSATNYVSDLTTDEATISATVTMASGVSSFGLSIDSSTEPTTWLTEDDNGTLSGTTWNLEYTCDESGTYYLWVKDANGNTTKLGSFVVKVPITRTLEILSKTDTTNLAIDTHESYTNTRYIGANPDNYACFEDGNGGCINYDKDNTENKPGGLFRIIGIFNEDTHGVTDKKLVKLITSDIYGNFPYDSNRDVNDWSTSSLKTILNETYLTNILTEEQQSMIATVTWHLGGISNTDSISNGLVSHWYGYERGTKVYSGHATVWIGKVALMYPSDFGYATSGGSDCLNNYYLHYNSSDNNSWIKNSICFSNDWLKYSESRTGTQGQTKVQWTISPSRSSSGNCNLNDTINGHYSYIAYNVRPSFYLKSETYITGGTGTSTNPYRFAM